MSIKHAMDMKVGKLPVHCSGYPTNMYPFVPVCTGWEGANVPKCATMFSKIFCIFYHFLEVFWYKKMIKITVTLFISNKVMKATVNY